MESLDLVSPYLFKHKRRNFLVKDKLRPKDLDALQHFEICPTDIFLITYPKSGGDWKNFFTVAQNEHFDNVSNKKMSNSPLTCTWEIKQ
eukprot:superscaffoldBa00003536_g17163